MARRMTTIKTLLIATTLVIASVTASLADGSADDISMGAGRYDLFRAHSERMIVFFGHEVSFKRYALVDMLHQYFTVAADVKGGVRHTLQDTAGEKTLVIE